MVLELVTVLLGAFVGVAAVLYVAPKGYLGKSKKKASTDSATSLVVKPVEVTSPETYATPTEQAVGVPAPVATTVAEPAPSPVQAIYETVQPTPAPVQYAPPATSFEAPSATSFGAPSILKKPTRTYRRRTAPVRSSTTSKASLKPKTKKR